MNNIDHPNHYNDGNIEVIDFIEDKELGFHLGNAIKYIARAGKKDPNKKIEDIQKAIWYLKRYVEIEKAKETHDLYKKMQTEGTTLMISEGV